MDSIVSTALSEICAQGETGISLTNLWPTLTSAGTGLPLCDNVKSCIWTRILAIPGLQFKTPQTPNIPSQHPSIQSFQSAQSINLTIVPAKHLRDCFIGLYSGDSGISDVQRRALERLAIARTNGVTQSQLAKEFNMKGNNIFYVLRKLECRGLITRQSSIVRTKENVGESSNTNSTSVVNTNLIHLYRYAKQLKSQQRLEITKEVDEGLDTPDGNDGILGEVTKDDVLVKDYIPAIKAICDKLDKADDKVLVVSDIKQTLGYRGKNGHRAWRNICNRLKDLVEKFDAKVDGKVVKCLRLLRTFDPKHLQPKSVGSISYEFDTHQAVNYGRRGQITDQLLELPIEHQIYNIIDAEGSKGLTITEVFKRLGLNNKKYYPRLLNMLSRFEMHLEAENHQRTVHYRVRTSKSFLGGPSNVDSGKGEDFLNKDVVSMGSARDLVLLQKSDLVLQKFDSSTSKGELRTPGHIESEATELESCSCSAGDVETNQMLICGNTPNDLVRELVGTDFDEENTLVNAINEPNDAPSDTVPVSSTKRRSYPRYPCKTLTAASTQREQRILQRLQEDKFILTVELYRWLESFEKDKPTTMDRKTLKRTLNKLQLEGHCKCIQISVPSVSNCRSSRTTDVVLHNSLQSLTPEVLDQIHERLRSFDMQTRAQGFAKTKKETAVPVLTNITRTLNHGRSDNQAVKAEAMRANGFVCAKMVRAKLLHNFLWKYLSSSLDWNDALSFGRHGYDVKNPHSTCKLFALNVAIKAMPVELFLQVAGSTQKFEYLFESCKRDLCLADLSPPEYKSLMNTQATGRLSWVIDILHRLKLIRMVTDGNLLDGEKIPCAVLTHALELKPYIEEPLSNVALSFGVGSVDLRPRRRHDFILSKKEAVDIYWKTLEYCYATADPRSAIHAFPGSSVHEVFLYRSWASVRVMTADQRAELLKHIVRDEPTRKISFADCINIARDLNLTVEQVLRVSNDKRQSRLSRFGKKLSSSEQEFQQIKSNSMSASQKRKRSLRAKLSKRLKSGTITGEAGSEKNCIISDNDNQYAENENLVTTQSEYRDACLEDCDEDRIAKMSDEVVIEDYEEENYELISQCASSRWRSTRQPKFLWTETSDRLLVIQYVRHRASLGARFHRTDWASLSGLPAPPDTCKRRMTQLNGNPVFRTAIMRLCNLLGGRYAKHLGDSQEKLLLCPVNGQTVEEISPEDLNRNFSSRLEETTELNLGERHWDDFEEPDVKMVLDEVLRCKQLAKLEASRRVGLTPEKEWPDILDSEACKSQEESEVTPSTTVCEETENHAGRRQRSSCHRLPGKFIKLLNEGINIKRRAYESVAVANAVELLKLVFLSTSTAVEVPNLLADTLRRYSEHDLFAAFNYLREKKFMVGGNGSQPFVLSQPFLHSISDSPFPMNTGKRAAKFVNWLQEREKDLMEDEVHLNADLQCGEIFHMLALVSSGELCILPCLPEEGIGEPKEPRSSKRKANEDELYGEDVKKFKSQDGEVISRKAKGFPGIKISLSRVAFSVADAVDLFGKETQTSSSLVVANDKTGALDVDTSSCLSPSIELMPSFNFSNVASVKMTTDGSLWKAVASYSEHLLSTFSDKELVGTFNAELFETFYCRIRKAGDQGLSMGEISRVMSLQGERIAEFAVDILQVFGLAVKVNAYNRVHVVDSSFRSKYFLTTVDGRYEDLKSAPCMTPQRTSDNTYSTREEYHSTAETSAEDEVHTITILNLPEEVSHLSHQVETCNNEDVEVGASVEGVNDQGQNAGSCHSFRPILPWVNGDGTTNPIVYKGLTRHVLGVVMQSPGILEDDIICRMGVLNPQSCRKLLELMLLDNHIFVRKMHQTTCENPPALLGTLFGGNFKKSESICRNHFFANPLSTTLL